MGGGTAEVLSIGGDAHLGNNRRRKEGVALGFQGRLWHYSQPNVLALSAGGDDWDAAIAKHIIGKHLKPAVRSTSNHCRILILPQSRMILQMSLRCVSWRIDLLFC